MSPDKNVTYLPDFSLTRGKRSVKEFPGIRSIEAPDDYRLQERWFEIT